MQEEDRERKALTGAILSLSEPERLVFTLREVEELTFAEIGSVLGIPEGEVRGIFGTARARFDSRWLSAHGIDEP